MCEMWKKKGLDPRKILGITTLDCVRANKFIAEIVGCNPAEAPQLRLHRLQGRNTESCKSTEGYGVF